MRGASAAEHGERPNQAAWNRALEAIARTLALGVEIGRRGLLVHAETEQARDFYRHLVPEFESSPTDELHRFLLMKDIRRTLGN